MKAKSQFRENRGKVSQDFEDWSSVATCNYYSSHVTVIHLTRSLALSLDLSEINKKKKKIDEFNKSSTSVTTPSFVPSDSAQA